MPLYSDMKYDLELDKVIKEIKKNKAKTVCIQLPDGLKPKAKEIVDAIESATKAHVLIWAGSNFGACDLALPNRNRNRKFRSKQRLKRTNGTRGF